MCSVVGYIGKNFCRGFVLEGLTRLEYRGYDSSGFACLDPQDNQLLYARSEGELSNLIKKIDAQPIDGFVGVGHTRWSTHGVATQENAHPQFDCQKVISIVHNGIIENHHELREQLKESGHTFLSSTDSEIIAHLFEKLLKSHTHFNSAVIDLLGRLDGAYAFISLLQAYPDQMLLVRKRNPLCIGIGENEMFVASDVLAFADKTRKVVFVPDNCFAIVKKDLIELYDFSGKVIPITIQEISADWTLHEKKGHEHFMLKEIYEQKKAIAATVEHLKSISTDFFKQVGLSSEQAKSLNSLSLIACGTSWHAARIAQFFFEQICLMPVKVHLASEFRYMSFFPERNTAYMAISQSGETADTLEALRLINDLQLPTIALTNIASSTIVREAHGYILTQAGHEVAVASTKAFSTQITALYWFANRLALEKGLINQTQMNKAQEDLLVAAQILESSIENYKIDIVQTLAKKYAVYKKSIFLGRNISYPFAMEAALKLKEIAYIFAQCYPAGELKHGPLALVDEQTPVFIFSNLDTFLYQKLVSNAQEVKARKGHLVAFAFEGQIELISLADQVFIIPNVHPLLGPLAMTGLMQFFFYHIAKELGCSIDKPRNLAKSVTVE